MPGGFVMKYRYTALIVFLLVSTHVFSQVFTEELYDTWISFYNPRNENYVQIDHVQDMKLWDEEGREITIYYINIQQVLIEHFSGEREGYSWKYVREKNTYEWVLEQKMGDWYKYHPAGEMKRIIIDQKSDWF